MGLDYTTHIGPYVHCMVNKVDSVETKLSCTNKECLNHKGCMVGKFCYDCGTPIGQVEYAIKSNVVNTSELRDKMKEALTTPHGDFFYEFDSSRSVDIWYGNKHRPDAKSRPFSFDPMEGSHQYQITPYDIEQDLIEFAMQYAVAIQMLKDAYGSRNVDLKWGIIHSIG